MADGTWAILANCCLFQHSAPPRGFGVTHPLYDRRSSLYLPLFGRELGVVNQSFENNDPLRHTHLCKISEDLLRWLYFSIGEVIGAVTGSDQPLPFEAPPQQRAFWILDEPAARREPVNDLLGPKHDAVGQHEVARRSGAAAGDRILLAWAAGPDDIVVASG